MSDPAERRLYERYEIKLPGRVSSMDGQQFECVVRDYCNGGVLVEQLKADAGGSE